jgi:uncharacterized protein YkwD
MARLRIEFRGAETLVSLARGETTIGRANTCTIHLPDSQLAPVHFRIRPKGDGFQLKDDGSGSGTRVNGKPVFAVTLRHGDRIEAGGLSCLFLAEADRTAPVEDDDDGPPEPPPIPAPGGLAKRWWILAGAGVAVVLVVLFVRDRSAKAAEAKSLWLEAGKAFEAASATPAEAEEDLRRGIALLERLQRDHPGSSYQALIPTRIGDAQRALTDLGKVEDLRRQIGDANDDTARELLERLAAFRGAQPAVAARADEVAEAVRRARTVRLEKRFAKAQEEAHALLAERKFGDALRVWRENPEDDFSYRERAAKERADLAFKVSEEYRGLLKLAGQGEDLDARIGLLEANRPVFAGTPQAEDLEVRIAALRARRASALLARGATPEPKKAGAEPGKKEPAPTAEPAAYEEPPEVKDLVHARKYGEAASLLASISRHPLAQVEVEELTLLANLMADLQAAIHARPAEYGDILLADGRADALDADATGIRATKDGAEVRCAWNAVPPKSFVKLFRIAGFDDPPRLAVALFFDDEDQPKEAEAAFAACFRSGQGMALLTRVVARRRGIPEPPEGFHLFRGHLVTPEEEHDTLQREEIEKLAKQARSPVDARRREAFDALEKMGAPATEALALALKERRAAVADALAHEKAFTPGRFASILGNDLRAAREAALAFILNPNLYPYPATSEEPQKEAERLVGVVRAICEQPYDRLLAKSDEARALDQELKELDARLARADPVAEPLYEATVEKIQKSIDGARIPLDERDRKRLEYNDQVAKYNRELKTTADDEERANVDAVNAYRQLMGLEALKIDERLVRCARKHSIEMRQRNYFAHESPTPQLRNPSVRAQREGYSGGVSENIALGASTGVEAFWQWYKSSGHHRNMLQPGHTEMGCGSEQHHWWTQNFGRLTGKSLDPPRVPPDPDPPGQSGNGDPAQ